jgi:hypothetical protein
MRIQFGILGVEKQYEVGWKELAHLSPQILAVK